MDNCILHLDDLSINEIEYGIYFSKWLDGIKSELNFWKHYIDTKGIEFNTKWDELISNDRPFELDEYLTSAETKFLDVGSGPFSSCGIKTNKTKMKMYTVDALAYIYKALKDKSKIYSGVTPDFAMVEFLDEKFEKNEFDIVLMQNALDHTFNPLIGILQMLLVCKIGGRVILKHKINEAENGNYSGLHQWNLCIDDHKFMIWRPGIYYNVTEILKEYVDFIINDDPNEYYFTVVLLKKKDIPSNCLPKYLGKIRNELIFKKFSELIVTGAYKSVSPAKVKIKMIVKEIPFLGYCARKIYKKC